MIKTEILAPAGDTSSLKLAIYNGANAVYLGLQKFNARLKADNFNEDNILQWTNFCHIHGVKVYVVINVGIKTIELEELKSVILACKEADVDAFIISDLATANLIMQYTDIPMHASTQIGVSNLEGAQLLEKIGFIRVVMARETRIEDIKAIKQNTSLEIEYFVHGALCVSYSGSCLFSSVISQESGNRGLCKQPCRQLYTSFLDGKKAKSGYLLSTSDLCLVNKLQELQRAGVCSFKIEGRLKRSEYVGEVVRVYANAIKEGVGDEDMSCLKRIYNRGDFTEGYAYQDTEDIMYPYSQGHKGELIGVVSKVIKTKKGYIGTLRTTHNLKEHDGFKVFRGETEVYGGEIINNGQISNSSYEIVYDGEVEDEFYITTDSRQIKRINSVMKKIPVDLRITVRIGEPVRLFYTYEEFRGSISSDVIVQLANKSPITKIDILEHLTRISDTPFMAKSVRAVVSDNAFFPKSILNDMRRNALLDIEQYLISEFRKTKQYIDYNGFEPFAIDAKQVKLSKKELAMEIRDLQQITNYTINCVTSIVYNPFNYNTKSIQKVIDYIASNSDKIDVYLKLPNMATGEDIELLRTILTEVKGLTGLYTNGLYGIVLAKEYKLAVFGGINLNLFNPIMQSMLPLTKSTLSVELSSKAIGNFNKDSYVYIYGYMPVMNLTHSVATNGFDNHSNASKQGHTKIYKDRKYSFEILDTTLVNTYSTMYNSVPTDLIEYLGDIPYNYYLDMVLLDEKQIDSVVKSVVTGRKQHTRNDYTKALFAKGAK